MAVPAFSLLETLETDLLPAHESILATLNTPRCVARKV
jgi:hypothetical protein